MHGGIDVVDHQFFNNTLAEQSDPGARAAGVRLNVAGVIYFKSIDDVSEEAGECRLAPWIAQGRERSVPA